MQFSDELVYSKSVSAHGNYKYLRITPIGSDRYRAELPCLFRPQHHHAQAKKIVSISRRSQCVGWVVGVQSRIDEKRQKYTLGKSRKNGKNTLSANLAKTAKNSQRRNTLKTANDPANEKQPLYATLSS